MQILDSVDWWFKLPGEFYGYLSYYIIFFYRNHVPVKLAVLLNFNYSPIFNKVSTSNVKRGFWLVAGGLIQRLYDAVQSFIMCLVLHRFELEYLFVVIISGRASTMMSALLHWGSEAQVSQYLLSLWDPFGIHATLYIFTNSTIWPSLLYQILLLYCLQWRKYFEIFKQPIKISDKGKF